MSAGAGARPANRSALHRGQTTTGDNWTQIGLPLAEVLSQVPHPAHDRHAGYRAHLKVCKLCAGIDELVREHERRAARWHRRSARWHRRSAA